MSLLKTTTGKELSSDYVLLAEGIVFCKIVWSSTKKYSLYRKHPKECLASFSICSLEPDYTIDLMMGDVLSFCKRNNIPLKD